MVRKKSSKGVSTVIGTIFLVLVVLMVATNVFLWSLMQNSLYNQAVQDLRQTEADRFSERIATSRTNFTVPETGTVQVDLTVSNEGPVSAQIITAWVVWTVEGEAKYGFNDTLDINLNPGQSFPLTTTVAIPDASSTGAFSGWLVTARGNMVSLEKEKIVVHAQVAEGIGSVMMDFDTFKYYKVEGDVLNFSESKLAFTVPPGKPVVFATFLSNYDLKRRTLTLHSHSLLWACFPQSATPKNVWWYIVNVASDGTIETETYTPISLAYSESRWIFFGSKCDLGNETFKSASIGKELVGYSAAINLILLGKIDGQDYGQNLPFVSIYVKG